MPKVKNASTKKSKKLVSNKKLSFSRFQVLGLCLILALSGVVVVLASHASGVPKPGTIGGVAYVIPWKAAQHTKGAGAPAAFYLQTPNGSTSLQVVQNVNASDDRTGNYMWWGAYHNVTADKQPIKVCWYYAAPSTSAAHIDFDVAAVYNNNRYVLFSTKSNSALSTIKPVAHPNLPDLPASSQPWVIQKPFCTVVNVALDPIPVQKTVKFLEIRAMDMGVAPGDENSFKLWQTTFQVL